MLPQTMQTCGEAGGGTSGCAVSGAAVGLAGGRSSPPHFAQSLIAALFRRISIPEGSYANGGLRAAGVGGRWRRYCNRFDAVSQLEFVQSAQSLPTNIRAACRSPFNCQRSQFEATLANSPPPG